MGLYESKERTSNNDDEPAKGDSVLFQQQEGNEPKTKRAKLTHPSNTTLQDIPIKQLQRILLKVIVAEVVDMRLIKSAWREKTYLVINRLKDVCLNWQRILSNNEFVTKVHRILDGMDIFPDIVDFVPEITIDLFVRKVTMLRGEIFMLCGKDDQQGIVNVYDRNNMSQVKDNIAEMKVKDVIALPETRPVDIEACNVSNCLYVLCLNMESECPLVLRVTKDEGNQYNSSPWISGLRLPVYSISVSNSGVLAVPNGHEPVSVSLYNTTGSLMKSADIHGFRYVDKVIQKPDGNLILASINGKHFERVITEISTDGKVQRQYKSTLGEDSVVSGTDKYGRVVISKPEPLRGISFLDCELNLVAFRFWGLDAALLRHHFHYNNESDELMSVCVFECDKSVVKIGRYT